MRRLAFLVSSALLAFVGCSHSSKPLIADVAFQLTCNGTPPANCLSSIVNGKAWDYVARDGADAVDMTSGVDLGRVDASCSVYDVGNGVSQVSISSQAAGAYVKIDGLRFVRSTGAYTTGSCRATIYDGSSLYGGSSLGVCSDAVPSSNNPCQVSNVTVDRNATDGPTIELRVFCTGLPNASSPTSQVSVRDSADFTQPAILRFANCPGL